MLVKTMQRALRVLLPALHFVVALLLLRAWFSEDMLPGGGASELDQRLALLHQQARWVLGQAPIGHADLLGFPQGRPFWSATPFPDLFMLALMPLVGDARAFALVTAALLGLTGLGPHLLARRLGASPAPALLAGVLLECSPFLLNSLEGAVVEMAAAGLPFLAALEMLRVLEGERRRLPWVGFWVLATALSSPYYAVFLVLACALALAGTWRSWRQWLQIVGMGALAGGFALGLLAAVEGPEGRLGFSDGFTVSPPQNRVLASGRPAPKPKRGQAAPPPGAGHLGADRPTRGPASAAPDPKRRPAGRPPRWRRILVRWPGGFLASLLLLAGLARRESRPWSAMGLFFFLLGPGVPAMVMALELGRPDAAGPLQRALDSLPLLGVLGNPRRMLVLVTALAGLAGARLLTGMGRWTPGLAVGLTVLALGELSLARPALSIPATPDVVGSEGLETLTGPALVLPAAHPPYWMEGGGQGSALLVTARASVPGAHDLRLGASASDHGQVAALARVGGLAMAEQAWSAAPAEPDWETQPYRELVLVVHRLEPEQIQALERWLAERADPQHMGDKLHIWRFRGPGGGSASRKSP